MGIKRFCDGCKAELGLHTEYVTINRDKYPEGVVFEQKLELCKTCNSEIQSAIDEALLKIKDQ